MILTSGVFALPGLCCGSLEEPKTLMKMGLSMIMVGHVNFMLGALVHGVVLRHINLHRQARAMEYAVSNVFAIASGLVVSVEILCGVKGPFRGFLPRPRSRLDAFLACLLSRLRFDVDSVARLAAAGDRGWHPGHRLVEKQEEQMSGWYRI